MASRPAETTRWVKAAQGRLHIPKSRLGKLIERVRDEQGLSQNESGPLCGMTNTRWRQIVYGERSRNGVVVPVRVGPEIWASMAWVVGLTPKEVRAVGRRDVADLLEKLGPNEALASRPPKTEPHVPNLIVPQLVAILRTLQTLSDPESFQRALEIVGLAPPEPEVSEPS